MRKTFFVFRVVPVIGLVALVSCSSSPVRFASSPHVPAAEGTVKTEETANNNTRLDVIVKHLAPVEKVNPEATTYVVWVAPSSGGAPINLGALHVDKNLGGEISTVTPLHDFKIFITAEASSQVTSPHGEQLLWTNTSTG